MKTTAPFTTSSRGLTLLLCKMGTENFLTRWWWGSNGSVHTKVLVIAWLYINHNCHPHFVLPGGCRIENLGLGASKTCSPCTLPLPPPFQPNFNLPFIFLFLQILCGLPWSQKWFLYPIIPQLSFLLPSQTVLPESVTPLLGIHPQEMPDTCPGVHIQECSSQCCLEYQNSGPAKCPSGRYPWNQWWQSHSQKMNRGMFIDI